MIALQNMRMACDSTYLLDQKTELGPKADEITTLLDEVFETPGVKAVVFSQWVRMHEVLSRRFAARRWGHVLFHGGIESAKRPELLDRFRDDPRCRALLSTDAGGVGLNLQHASVVINVDLPWNPAVLEQRIGRVHRLGQSRPVQVVNFVAQGTIEEGMLSLLGFKKSLFAGVLDGGEREVFLGGSRLTRFIESVDKVTGQIPAAATAETADAQDSASARDSTSESADTEDPIEAPTPLPDPLAGLLQGGLALLDQLATTLRTPAADSAETGTRRAALETLRDEATGERYIRFKMPPPEVVDRVFDALRGVLAALGQTD